MAGEPPVTPSVLRRPAPGDGPADRARTALTRAARDAVHRAWDAVVELGAIGPDCRRGRRFGHFGEGSVICFPPTTIFNEQYIHIGSHTMFGPGIALSAGMVPGQQCVSNQVVRIGDRCLIGRGSGIVGHLSIEIGDDVWTGHHVYITDQNHGYEDLDLPISKQVMPERPVRIGDGSWLGHGTIVLPGSTIGRHVVVAAGSVVTGDLPDFSVCAGVPARVLRRHVEGAGWVRVTPETVSVPSGPS
jgi:acetyltransferase-like isoleucine patch superfamily enzyme